VIDVEDGETVLQAALRHGYRWPSICNGDGVCGVCYMIIDAGGEGLSEKQATEADRLALGVKACERRARLGCQTNVSGEVTVTRRGVKAKT
jgi:ferredoxin